MLFRVVAEKMKEVLYTRPRKYIRCSSQEPTEPGYINILELAESMCRYDLDDMDIFWLQEVNEELAEMGEYSEDCKTHWCFKLNVPLMMQWFDF